jgi:hypothetical protein
MKDEMFWAGGVVQSVQRLPSQLEAPSSNPSTTRNKKRKMF